MGFLKEKVRFIAIKRSKELKKKNIDNEADLMNRLQFKVG